MKSLTQKMRLLSVGVAVVAVALFVLAACGPAGTAGSCWFPGESRFGGTSRPSRLNWPGWSDWTRTGSAGQNGQAGSPGLKVCREKMVSQALPHL